MGMLATTWLAVNRGLKSTMVPLGQLPMLFTPDQSQVLEGSKVARRWRQRRPWAAARATPGQPQRSALAPAPDLSPCLLPSLPVHIHTPTCKPVDLSCAHGCHVGMLTCTACILKRAGATEGPLGKLSMLSPPDHRQQLEALVASAKWRWRPPWAAAYALRGQPKRSALASGPEVLRSVLPSAPAEKTTRLRVSWLIPVLHTLQLYQLPGLR